MSALATLRDAAVAAGIVLAVALVCPQARAQGLGDVIDPAGFRGLAYLVAGVMLAIGLALAFVHERAPRRDKALAASASAFLVALAFVAVACSLALRRAGVL